MRREKVRSAMPSEPLTASARLADFKIWDHAILRLFCPTSQTVFARRIPATWCEFFNDLYCAWGCFRVFLSSLLRGPAIGVDRWALYALLLAWHWGR
jgi:hypothetical protein